MMEQESLSQIEDEKLDYTEPQSNVYQIICQSKDPVLGSPTKIRIYGTKRERDAAIAAISTIADLPILPEPEARLKIQEAIDRNRLKARIMVNGNGVWSRRRIIQNLRKIMQAGTLYNGESPRKVWIGSFLSLPSSGKTILSKYFYEFLHLCCGSIAHYNIRGWIIKYPTLKDLRAFFLKNEYGHRVIDYIPEWKADVKLIVQEIERILFPTQQSLV